MKQWLDEGLPDFFLLNKAFNLNLIINIILNVTGYSSFNYNLYFALTNDISSDSLVSLEYDGFLGDTQNWLHLVGDEHHFVLRRVFKNPVRSKLLIE